MTHPINVIYILESTHGDIKQHHDIEDITEGDEPWIKLTIQGFHHEIEITIPLIRGYQQPYTHQSKSQNSITHYIHYTKKEN